MDARPPRNCRRSSYWTSLQRWADAPRGTSAHTVLPTGVAWCPPPACGHHVHQKQPPTGLSLGARRGQGRGRPFRGGGVRDLDTDQARGGVEGEPEAEVASGHPAVLDGVRREFADDEGDRAREVRRRRVTPLLHVPDGKTPGEPRPSPRGGELPAQRGRFAFAGERDGVRRKGCDAPVRLVSRRGRSCQHGLSVLPCRTRSIATYTCRHVPCSRVVVSPYAQQVAQPYCSGHKQRK